MPVHIYPFYKVSDEIKRPWIPVRIVNNKTGDYTDTMALLDTGADHCVFPNFVAEQCKHNLQHPEFGTEDMQGMGKDKINVSKHGFRIELQSPDRKQTIWKSKDMIVGCVEHDNIAAILGFSNFMCHFKITFNHATNRIIVDTKPTI